MEHKKFNPLVFQDLLSNISLEEIKNKYAISDLELDKYVIALDNISLESKFTKLDSFCDSKDIKIFEYNAEILDKVLTSIVLNNILDISDITKKSLHEKNADTALICQKLLYDHLNFLKNENK